MLSSSKIKVTKPPSASIEDAQSWSGTVYVPQNLTIESTGHLTIEPGTKVFFQYTSGATVSLLAYGRLTAIGRPTQPITFGSNYSTGTQSSWGSITFYGSSTLNTLEYATIERAQIGIGSLSSSLTIEHCTLQDNYYGIYLDGASPTMRANVLEDNINAGIYLTGSSTATRIQRNTIRGSRYGIWCNNYSSPTLDSNLIENHSIYGLRCENHSSPHLAGPTGPYWYAGGYNTIRDVSLACIYAYNYSQPWLGAIYYGGYNSVYGEDDWPLHLVRADGSSRVDAEHTYWGEVFPPLDDRFLATQGSVINRLNPLQEDPNAGGSGLLKTGGASPAEDMPRLPSALDSAFVLERQGKATEAERAYLEILQAGALRSSPEPELIGALSGLSRLYQRENKQGLLQVLAAPAVAQALGQSDALRVLTAELQAFWLSREGKPEDALCMLQALPGEFPLEPDLERRTLETRALLTARALGKRTEALALAAELREKYPVAAQRADELPILIEIAARLHAGEAASGALGKDQARQAQNLPVHYGLSEAYPNPFNPETNFQLALPAAAQVRLTVYDVLGREVARLADGSYEAGTHTLRWNARTQIEHSVASGVYFARLQVKDALGRVVLTKTHKLLLVR